MNILAWLFVILSVSMLLNNCLFLKQGDENVCLNNSTGVLFCCFNYEKYNGQCVECEKGYTSEDGEPCTLCKGEHFGYRCLLRCKCENYQTCNPINGCVDRTESTVSASEVTKGTTLDTIQLFTNQPESENATSFDIETCLSNPYLIIMGIAISVLLLYLCGSHISCVVMFKRLKNNRNTPMHENDYDEIGTVHYDVVSSSPITDENSVVSIVPSAMSHDQEDNVSLENDNSDENSKKTDSLDGSERCIDSTRSSNEEGHSYVNDLPGAGIVDEYVHQYNSLHPSMETENPYTTCLSITDTNINDTDDNERACVEHYINIRI